MTIEERISDDLRQLSADFLISSWQGSNNQKSDREEGDRAPSAPSKGKSE